MRDAVRAAFGSIASRFSDDVPSVDERVLRARYSAVGAWPADSQLGLLVLAWVLGPGFSLKGFREAVNSLVPNFDRAALAVSLGGSSTLTDLGEIARCGFRNGGVVVRTNLDPEALYWPLDLAHTMRS